MTTGFINKGKMTSAIAALQLFAIKVHVIVFVQIASVIQVGKNFICNGENEVRYICMHCKKYPQILR